jgi:hypothetical protein
MEKSLSFFFTTAAAGSASPQRPLVTSRMTSLSIASTKVYLRVDQPESTPCSYEIFMLSPQTTLNPRRMSEENLS